MFKLLKMINRNESETFMGIPKELLDRMDSLGVKLKFDGGTKQYTARFGEFTEASMALKRKKVEAGVHENVFSAIMLLMLNAIEAFDVRRNPNLHARLYLLHEAARAARSAKANMESEPSTENTK